MFEKARIQNVKEQYPAGCRVKLLEMLGERLEAGAIGTIEYVDDLGTVHVSWDCGSTLGLLPDVDRFVLLG